MPVPPLRYVSKWQYCNGWYAKLSCGHIKSVRRARALREQKRDEVQMRCPECGKEEAA